MLGIQAYYTLQNIHSFGSDDKKQYAQYGIFILIYLIMLCAKQSSIIH